MGYSRQITLARAVTDILQSFVNPSKNLRDLHLSAQVNIKLFWGKNLLTFDVYCTGILKSSIFINYSEIKFLVEFSGPRRKSEVGSKIPICQIWDLNIKFLSWHQGPNISKFEYTSLGKHVVLFQLGILFIRLGTYGRLWGLRSDRFSWAFRSRLRRYPGIFLADAVEPRSYRGAEFPSAWCTLIACCNSDPHFLKISSRFLPNFVKTFSYFAEFLPKCLKVFFKIF